jgi:heterodisulfide reductase subunit C
MELVVRGAMEYGEPGVFLSFEETSGELVNNVASLGFSLPDIGNLHYCFNCSTCVSGCPASHRDPRLLVRNLARKVILGLEEFLQDDTPWAFVSCSRYEERCPMNVMPFEMILAIRQWQCRNDETLAPSAIVEIYKWGFQLLLES